MSDYCTTDDFAQLARTSPGTVRYWRSLGKGPVGVRVGRRVLYRRADVLRWLEAHWADAAQGENPPAA